MRSFIKAWSFVVRLKGPINISGREKCVYWRKCIALLILTIRGKVDEEQGDDKITKYTGVLIVFP